MKITYDKSVDAAYIYLISKSEFGTVKKTHTCDVNDGQGMINLDFDTHGKLVGIEILDASKKLPQELLNQAIIIG